MRNDVHLEALKAAARVAFSVAFLGGCAAATNPANDDGSDDGPQASEDDLRASSGHKKKHHADASTTPTTQAPCHGSTDVDAGSTEPVSCDAVLASTFPTPSNYPGDKKEISAQAASCCEQILTSGNLGGEHRWDCCANIAWNGNEQIGMACTPWGPPVPPAMKRRARRGRPVDAWMMQGVA